jgi:hypothetical protein
VQGVHDPHFPLWAAGVKVEAGFGVPRVFRHPGRACTSGEVFGDPVIASTIACCTTRSPSPPTRQLPTQEEMKAGLLKSKTVLTAEANRAGGFQLIHWGQVTFN